jgi:DNA-binding transcriptional ArsR family regulator
MDTTTMSSKNKQPMEAVDEPPDEVSEDSSPETVERTEPEAPSLDLIFGILKNGRRRRVLKYLREIEGEVTLSDLAEHIAAIENDTTPKQLTSSERKRVYVGLYQCHLPKMDDAGVIEYNQARGLIRSTEQSEHFETYLDRSAEDEGQDWYQYYGGVSLLGLVPFALSVGTTVSTALVSTLWIGVVLGLVGLSAYHWSVSKNENGRDASP